jgi:hypothetical protein
MIYRFTQPANTKVAESFALPPPSDTTGTASFDLAPPPSATLYSLPELAFNPEERNPNPDRRFVNIHGTVIFGASSDGLLLVNVSRHRVGAQASRELPMQELVKEVVEEEHARFVCNPVTGQLFRLPVGIYPRINHMKLNEYTQRLLFIAKRAYRTLHIFLYFF